MRIWFNRWKDPFRLICGILTIAVFAFIIVSLPGLLPNVLPVLNWWQYLIVLFFGLLFYEGTI